MKADPIAASLAALTIQKMEDSTKKQSCTDNSRLPGKKEEYSQLSPLLYF